MYLLTINLLSFLYFVVVVVYRSFSVHMALDATYWRPGKQVWYLKRSLSSVANHDVANKDDDVLTLRLLPAVIKAVHLENGVDHPYYTIEIRETIDEPTASGHEGTHDNNSGTKGMEMSTRELQTEWYRYVK